ncbi:MAG: uncharacterized protein QG608_2117 [Actinomycetota bacterium]|nr:uncharacterized protein [Actinomycetota bacterium]
MPGLLESLADTRIVVVQGARQVGKTTLVRQTVERLGGRLVTLDDDLTREAAVADPAGFLRQNPEGLLAIDEVQRAPGLVLALKAAVDADPRPGRFLLTGSADLLRLPTMQDSLAGRAENVDLYGFSQGEIAGVRERFVERILNGDTFLDHRGALSRTDYLIRACAGGYPEALTRPAGRRRSAWFDNYVRRIVERDAPDLSRLQRLSELPLLLRLLAARNANELNVSGLASDAGIPVRTLGPYLDLLETLFLVHRLPSWSTNLSSRVIARPKIVLQDTGLAARLINASALGATTNADAQAVGSLLEGFVAGELRRQLTWSDQNARLFHHRDRQGSEVDFLLETDDGRVAGIEVKAASTVTARDTKWLAQLRDRLGDRFVAGVVLHTGDASFPFGPRVAAVPLDVLWAP